MAVSAVNVTKEDIKQGLERLGIRPGCILGVHSSLGSFGHVVGGANTVLEALFENVGPDGTIVMSTYLLTRPIPLTEQDTASGLTWKVRRIAFDDLDTPSGMGIIADTFKRRRDVVRWYHPVHSLTAWGKDAAIYCQGFKPLVEAGGSILLLGVQMDRCSALHLAEEQVQLPDEIQRLMEWEVPEELHQVYPSKEWAIGGKGSWGDFLIVQQEAEKLGLITNGMIGLAAARLFSAGPMVALYKKLLEENPYRMFGAG